MTALVAAHMCQLMYMHYSIYHLLLFHVVRKLATRLGSRSLSAAAPPADSERSQK